MARGWNQGACSKQLARLFTPLQTSSLARVLIMADNDLSSDQNHVRTDKPIDFDIPGTAVHRVVTIGGASKSHLLTQLAAAGVELNAAAQALFASELFTVLETTRSIPIVELSVGQLGFPQGATQPQLFEQAFSLGLGLAPVELGPHLRLQCLDQPEGFWGHQVTEHQAPPGSIQIASAPLSEDDQFPKGFYLRRIKGVLWLRGYWSDLQHIYQPLDRFVFCSPEAEFETTPPYQTEG